MIKNYFNNFLRNFIRNRFYTLLNISGLAIGLASTLFILLYIHDELGYDKYHEKHDRIYRLESEVTVNNDPKLFATAPEPLGPALKQYIPEIESVVRFDAVGIMNYRYQEKQFTESKFYLADSTIFGVFTHTVIQGDPSSCLSKPYSLVLTESTSNRYFAGEDPIGKVLTDGNGNQLMITAIVEDLPGNSHLRFDGLISMSSDPDTYSSPKPSRLWNLGCFTFVLMHRDAPIEILHQKFANFYRERMEELGTKYGVSFRLMTTPLAKTHFRKGLNSELPSGSLAYIYIFSAIATFVLLIASSNYMNLATARSANRAREVGIRKVVGADRFHLIRQFIGESLFMSVFALILALVIVFTFLPMFNQFTGKLIAFQPIRDINLILEILVITILVGLLAGSYPALYISAFNPVSVLKGHVSKSGKTSSILRKILVIIQFFLAILMIIATLAVSGQLNYLRTTDLGYNRDNTIVFEIPDKQSPGKLQVFKDRLLGNANILSVTNSSSIPGIIAEIQNLKIEQPDRMTDRATIIIKVDFDFISTFEMKLTEGRNFDRLMATDELEAAIINEKAVESFGWNDQPIGKKIYFGFKQDGTGGRMLKVIGVVKDFYFKSLHNAIEPVVIFITTDTQDFLTCRLNPIARGSISDFLEIAWMESYSGYPFRFRYIADRLEELYRAEVRINRFIRLATIITMFLALMGLLGLSAFIAEQKTKEIGIRKVLGASILDILRLLYREFVILFLIAYLLAIPVAWWRLNLWLDSTFIYYQSLQWTIFIWAGAIVFIVGLGTVSWFVLRAAIQKPLESIKYE